MYIDTHAHLNFKNFKGDADEVIRSTLAEDTWMVIAGSNYKTSKNALSYANKYEKGVYAAVGLHPTNIFPLKSEDNGKIIANGEEYNFDIYEKLSKFDKVVAVGEIGLDYYRLDSSLGISHVKETQKKVLYQQLLLARQLDLPAIIHCRQAHDDLLCLLAEFKREHRALIPKERPWAVIHCFSGDEDLAWKYFGMGIIISFTGLITFSKQWDDLIRRLPSDKYMIETDCPYMTPEPFRGTRNEPLFVKYVAHKIAEIKNLPPQTIADVTTENAKRFFRI